MKCWLRKRGLVEDDEELCSRILTAAKAAALALTEVELKGLLNRRAAP